ncbi:MAG TPA: hypothetical protein VFW27_38065 [Actinoplanes sp.]|nr:hypothetical protein [Actinoplanes sp.]
MTARTAGGSEVRMRRTMQTVAIPVFQFGIFSDNDLSFFAGPNFNFGGRVHTNQNLYLAEGPGNTLLMTDRVTAVGDIVRSHLSNGENTQVATNGTTYTGTVRIAKAANCATLAANCRDLAVAEDSVQLGAAPPVPPSNLTWVDTDGLGPLPGRWEMIRRLNNVVDPAWDGISRGQYNSWIRNGDTGARRLDLPIVDVTAGTTPIDLIRRPRAGDPTGPGTPFEERFFRLASIRILLSDTAAEITGLPTVTATPPVNLSNLLGNAAYTAGTPTAASIGGGSTRLPAGTALVRGFLKIERQSPAGVWDDVTMRVLNLGIAGRNLSDGNLNTPDTNQCLVEPFPNAIIRLQRLKDNPANGAMNAGGTRRCGNGSTVATDYWPNAFYDAREGTRRLSDVPAGNVYLGGVMNYIELDVNNLRRWLNGTTDGGFIAAGSVMNTTGYVVYVSDRRNNKNAANAETGEFGYEDFINPATAASTSNNLLDAGEDFNGNGALDVYGNTPRVTGGASPYDGTGTLRTLVSGDVARQNPTMFFRRALKIVNAGQGQLPAVGSQGLTIATENPAYIQGNFNACGTMTTDCPGPDPNTGFNANHVSAALLADSVTLLSRNWNDIRSFITPHDAGARPGLTTWYRLGIISGKGISFARPTSDTANDAKDFGTDGGAHNFLRFLEDWNGTLFYRGSIISLFTSRQGTGVYKCCTQVYQPPNRGYAFDAEFLQPSLLPPRTPMFRDVNTLTFRQVLRPTQ